MVKTIDILFNIIEKNIPMSNSVLHDYFGNNNNYEIISIILGLYAGLIKIKGIPKKLIENCFITNRLDELIHKKYKHHKSQYYKIFCEKNIKIGETYINLNEDDNKLIEKMEIYDDDYCPNCNIEGYITKENYKFPNYKNCNFVDCYLCYNNVCIFCSNYDTKKENFICHKCNKYKNPILLKTKKNIDNKTPNCAI